MEIIKKLPVYRDEYNEPIYSYIFYCPYCKQNVIRSINYKKAKSCGCHKIQLRKETAKCNNPNYGTSAVYHAIYCRWIKMKRKGISDEWDTFGKFKQWTDSNNIGPDVFVRRIDKTKPYAPNNIEVYRKTCSNEELINKVVDMRNKKITVRSIAINMSISENAVYYLMKKGKNK